MFAAAPSLPQLDAAFDDDSMLYSCTSVGQRELLQILRAYVAFDHAIGYCQGMNFLAANLLMVIGNPEVTFWSLVQVMKSVKGLFAHGLPLYNLCLDLFGQQCRRYLPTIAGHLERQKTQLVTFAGAWFNTLFANGVVPIPLMHRIWDLFLFYGLPVIFQVALAILKACEGTLQLPPNLSIQPASQREFNANAVFVRRCHSTTRGRGHCSVPLSLAAIATRQSQRTAQVGPRFHARPRGSDGSTAMRTETPRTNATDQRVIISIGRRM